MKSFGGMISKMNPWVVASVTGAVMSGALVVWKLFFGLSWSWWIVLAPLSVPILFALMLLLMVLILTRVG